MRHFFSTATKQKSKNSWQKDNSKKAWQIFTRAGWWRHFDRLCIVVSH